MVFLEQDLTRVAHATALTITDNDSSNIDRRAGACARSYALNWRQLERTQASTQARTGARSSEVSAALSRIELREVYNTVSALAGYPAIVGQRSKRLCEQREHLAEDLDCANRF